MENRNKKRTGKLLLVLNILMLFALIAVPTYAFFWNDRIVDNKNIVSGTVTEGLVVVTPGALLNSDKKLIPSSAHFSDEDLEVKELVYTITVGLDTVGLDTYKKLNVENLKVTVTKNRNWLIAEVKKEVVDDNVKVTITFTIELTKEQWTEAHNNATHNVEVTLSFDPIVPTPIVPEA